MSAARTAERTDWRQVWLIAGLRWRLLVAGFRERPVTTSLRLVMTAVFLAIAVVTSVVLAIAIAGLVDAGEPELAATAVHLAFALAFLALSCGPLIAVGRNESLDVTKLFPLPVSQPTLLVATLLGSLTSLPTLALTAVALAVTLGFGGTAVDRVLHTAVALLLVVTSAAIGRTLVIAFHVTLQSRRWRDLTLVLMPMVGGAVYFGFRMLIGDLAPSQDAVRTLLEELAGRLVWLAPLPSAWAAGFVTGDGLPAWLLAGALLTCLVTVMRLGARAHAALYAGDEESGGRAELRVSSGLVDRFPGQLGALLGKDLRLLRREPVVRVLFVQQFAYAGLPLVFVLWRGMEGGTVSGWIEPLLTLAPLTSYMLLAFELGFLVNMLGLEGRAAGHTLVTAVPRRSYVLSKGLAHLIVLGGLNGLLVGGIVLGVHAVAGTPVAGLIAASLLGATEAVCAIGSAIAAGLVWSILFPVALVGRRRASREASQIGKDGCLGVFRGFAGLAVMFSAAAPVLLAFRLPEWLDRAGWIGLTAPLAVLWTAALFGLGVATGAELLVRREERVLGRLIHHGD